jgi:hypothetical protein
LIDLQSLGDLGWSKEWIMDVVFGLGSLRHAQQERSCASEVNSSAGVTRPGPTDPKLDRFDGDRWVMRQET